MASISASSSLGNFNLLPLSNEKFVAYGPGSAERAALESALADLKEKAPLKVHPIVNGEEIVGDLIEAQCSPFEHEKKLANWSQVTPELVDKAIDGALDAKKSWARTSLHDRAAIFYRAAALLDGPYRYQMMAATMLGQGKNAYQAEIDCTAESIDFMRTFPALVDQLYKNQPPINAPNVWNRTEARPLDGFVYGISPFNFTALAVNIILAPVIVGNVVVWKPSPGAIYSSWLLYQILAKAGLPAGVIQFVPGDAEAVTAQVYKSRDLGGLHFTGSTTVFRSLVANIGTKMNFWKSYPRVVGETGGKNFHLVHSTADVNNAALKSVRAAFEYQGQKCSALSRVYVARSVADEFKAAVVKATEDLTMGSKFTDFVGPVISRSAYDRVSGYIQKAKDSSDIKILAGGQCDDSVGYYIRPTVVESLDPRSKFMSEEIFGPFMAIYVYDDADFGPKVFELIDTTTQYALSGAVFAASRAAVVEATEELRFSAGNFYINDQCTGAMPGQQPFGGSRASGTNDKAGTAGLLTRFMSQRTIKESFTTIDSVLYPSNLP